MVALIMSSRLLEPKLYGKTLRVTDWIKLLVSRMLPGCESNSLKVPKKTLPGCESKNLKVIKKTLQGLEEHPV